MYVRGCLFGGTGIAQPLTALQSPLSQARGLQAHAIIQTLSPLRGKEGGLRSMSLCLEAAQVWTASLSDREQLAWV